MSLLTTLTTSDTRTRWTTRRAIDLGLILCAVLLFGFSFPGLVFAKGIFPLAFIALTPLFIVIRRASWYLVPIYGFLYGYIAYNFFNFWLATFHPLSIVIVPFIYGIYFIFVFLALKLAHSISPKYGFLLQTVIWLMYEFLRTKWYLGYSYGIIGYSQYQFLPLIQSAEWWGVWGISAIVVLISALLAQLLRGPSFRAQCITYRTSIITIASIFLLLVGIGLFLPVDYSESPTQRMALIQQHVNPWEGGIQSYRKSFEALVRQSNLAKEHDPDMVIWPETAFVPSINFHARYRGARESYELIEDLNDFLQQQEVPYVIGNSDGQLRRTTQGEFERVDYNAVVLYDDGEYTQTYRKTHLVPFTESFPYKRSFPWLYRLLVENDVNFWEQGDEYTVFRTQDIAFSTPICFEDTFGYISRKFVQQGAQLIVNLSNDSWSSTPIAAVQHYTIAIFRTIENRRSMVRSTYGGITAVIDPNGRTLDKLPPFVEDNLVHDVPIFTDRTTLYTRYGDWFAWCILGLGTLWILGGALYRIILSKKNVSRQ